MFVPGMMIIMTTITMTTGIMMSGRVMPGASRREDG
jgi:hypothetical protein